MAAELSGLISAGRRSDAVQHFLIEAVELRPAVVAVIRASRMWPATEALAPTLLYDLALADGVRAPLLVDYFQERISGASRLEAGKP